MFFDRPGQHRFAKKLAEMISGGSLRICGFRFEATFTKFDKKLAYIKLVDVPWRDLKGQTIGAPDIKDAVRKFVVPSLINDGFGSHEYSSEEVVQFVTQDLTEVGAFSVELDEPGDSPRRTGIARFSSWENAAATITLMKSDFCPPVWRRIDLRFERMLYSYTFPMNEFVYQKFSEGIAAVKGY